jgi:hypothetical protein
MLSMNQVAEMERAMEDEHRRDREALDRLKRFLPRVSSNGNGHGAAASSVDSQDTTAQDDSEAEVKTDTLIGRVRQLLKNDPSKGWTVPSVIEHLEAGGYTFAAKAPESSLGLTFAKLVRKKEARITRRGSGRIPHVYKAAKEETIEVK